MTVVATLTLMILLKKFESKKKIIENCPKLNINVKSKDMAN